MKTYSHFLAEIIRIDINKWFFLFLYLSSLLKNLFISAKSNIRYSRARPLNISSSKLKTFTQWTYIFQILLIGSSKIRILIAIGLFSKLVLRKSPIGQLLISRIRHQMEIFFVLENKFVILHILKNSYFAKKIQ